MVIHLSRDGKDLGSFPSEDVRAGWQSGKFLPTDYAWTEGLAEWKTLAEFPELAPPPTPPPAPIAAPAPPPLPPKIEPTASAAAAAPSGPARPAPSSGLAVTSLICGILSL